MACHFFVGAVVEPGAGRQTALGFGRGVQGRHGLARHRLLESGDAVLAQELEGRADGRGTVVLRRDRPARELLPDAVEQDTRELVGARDVFELAGSGVASSMLDACSARELAKMT